MNKSYTSVWNEALGSWVAASELSHRGRKHRKAGATAIALAAAALLGSMATPTSAAQFYLNEGSDGTCARMMDGNPTGTATSNVIVNSTTCSVNSVAALSGSERGTLVLNSTGAFLNGGMSIGGVLDLNNNQIRNVAAGNLSATSTDAVNGQQLNTTNQNVTGVTNTLNGITSGGGIRYFHANSTLADSSATGSNAIAAGGAATASAASSTAIGANAVASQSGSVALGAGATTAAAVATTTTTINGTSYNFAGTAPASTVSVGAAGAERTVTNVAAGRISATSTDAVNGSQLNAANSAVGTLGGQLQSEVAKTNATGAATAAALGGGAAYNAGTGAISAPSYAVGGTAFNNVGGALGDLDGRVATNTTNIATNTTAIGNLGVRVTNVDGSVNDLASNLNSGSVGLVKQDASSRTIAVAQGTDGALVDFSGSGGARTLTGVAPGAVNARSFDAINGSQLHGVSTSVASALGGGSVVNANGTVSAPSYAVGGTTFNNVGGALGDLDGRVAINTTNIAGNTTAIGNLGVRVTNVEGSVNDLANNLNSGSVGLVKQDASSRTITVAQGTDGALVDFSGSSVGARTLTGVAAGAVNARSLDAINGSQLHGSSTSVASALGGGSVVNANGTVSAPSYSVDGKTVNNVGDAIKDIDGRTSLNTQGIADITTNLNNGALGLVQQDADSKNITVAKNLGGSMVDFTGTGGARVLGGVAAGAVNESSQQAVNGSQLHGVSSSVANALGGGTTVGADGRIVAPTYTINNATYSSVNDALQGLAGNIDSAGSRLALVERVTSTSQADSHVATSGDQALRATASGNNAVAIGTAASATADNSVALGANAVADRANTVSVGSAGNERAIANVADAVNATDAVNKRQLDSAVDSARAYTDQQIGQVQQAVGDVARNAYSGVAAATALTMIPNVDPDKKFAMGVGAAGFKGYGASAVGIAARLNERLQVKAGVGVSSAGTSYGVGASFQW